MKLKFLFILLFTCSLFAQETEEKPYSIDASYFYGTILQHNKDLAHLITGHPTGVILSYNRRTYGFNDWEARYNYPDWGFSFTYQDLKNRSLGENFGLYGHFNFYFLNRNLMARVGQGIAVASNPFDLDNNYRNNAYGSRLLSSTYVMLNYKKANILDNLGIQAGISVIHYSNANVKAPNSSTNTLAFNIGVNYQVEKTDFPAFIPENKTKYSESVKLNLAFRSGVNESDYIGLGQRAFYVFSAFVDKRISHKSTLQAGADLFLSKFLKDQIEYESVAFPSFGVSGDEDYKRVGLFVGHELRFNKVALVSQFGYYVYYPYNFEGRIYERVGLKRYFGEHIFGAVTVKAHAAKAECVEFSLGWRF